MLELDRYLTFTIGEDTPPAINQVIYDFKKSVFEGLYSSFSSSPIFQQTHIPKPPVKVSEVIATVDNKMWIAGGSILSYFLNEEPKDYDIFFATGQLREAFLSGHHFGKIIEKKYSTILPVLNALDTTLDINRTVYSSITECLDEFDFVVCKIAITPTTLICHPGFFMDLATKTLSYRGYKNPAESLFRMQKMMNRGFNITRKDFNMLLEFVRADNDLPEVDLENEDSQDQWITPSGPIRVSKLVKVPSLDIIPF